MPITKLILNIVSPFGDYLDWNNFTSLILIIAYIPYEYYLRCIIYMIIILFQCIVAIASCGINPYQYLSKSKVIDFFTDLGNTVCLSTFNRLYEEHDYNHDGRMSFEELFSWYRDCPELFIDLDFIRAGFQSTFLGKVISKRIIHRKLEYANIKSFKKHHYGHDPPIPCYISIIDIIMRYPNPLHYDFDFNDEITGEAIMANCIREYLIEKYHIRSSHDIHTNFISKIRPDYKENNNNNGSYNNNNTSANFMMMKKRSIPYYSPYSNVNTAGNYYNKKVTLNASIASSKRSIRTYSTSDNDNTSYSSKNTTNNNNNNANRVSEISNNNYTTNVNKFMNNSSSAHMKISQRKSTKTSENTTKYVSDYAKKTISINELPGMINSQSCSSSFK